jgi:Acetyltransferase (GNAT) domain
VSQSAFTVRRTAPRDAPDLLRFAEMAFGAKWSEAFVRWKYFENPAGPIFGACAEMDGRPVAYYGNIPVRLKVGGEVVMGAQAVDAMVAPEARRRGLFVALGNETYRQMDEAGVALTYAFPNPVSFTAFVERMAWTPVGDVPRFVRVLDGAALARAGGRSGAAALVYRLWLWAFAPAGGGRAGAAPGVAVETVQQFDGRFDALWDEVAPGLAAVAVARDSAYLNWRYVRHPAAQYTVLAAERAGRLAGFVVLSLRDAQTMGVAALTELLVAPGNREVGAALLAEAVRRAQAARAAQVQCWLLPHHAFYRELLEGAGFVFRPGRYAPGALRYTTLFIVRPHPARHAALDLAREANWYLSAGDYDYF